jgi:tRNA(Ile)-lysidine synthase
MLTAKFIETIKRQNLFQTADKLLLAVSGGVDSIVLCEICYRAGYDFAIAHANFQLRGEESEEDERFVRSLAAKYGVYIHVKTFNTGEYADENKVSIQVAARQLRYAWFDELLEEGFKYVLTAHHRDDNIETAMMNFFRGTGVAGLRGMLYKNNTIVRPLLDFTKEEIIAFANEHNLQWRDDSSNASEKYSRNFFRQTVIPSVKKIFPEAEQNIAANIGRFRETEILYRQAIAQHKKRLLEIRGNEIHIPVLKLKKSEPLPTILYEIISEYNFTAHQVADAIHLLDAEQSSYIQSPTHRIIKNRNWLIIAANTTETADVIIIEKENKNTPFANGFLRIEHQEKPAISSTPGIACLDAKDIKYPLILRKWKQGDYFYPLGMPKKKKIARFLIDQKLSRTQKENTWVLESAKKICWIVGLRIDDRFKVKDNTKEMIKISLEPR